MACCLCTGEVLSQPDHFRWNDHPARQDWEVLKDLGEGAFAQVVLARHRRTGEVAALKVVFLESPAADPVHIKIMLREAEVLPMLDHPNIVECKDVIRSPRQLVLVLEWLRGGQIMDRLHELGPEYSEQQAAELFEQMAQAVAHMHEYGILHRDIKPENVMFARVPEGGRGYRGGVQGAFSEPPLVKIVDLGMAAYYNPKDLVMGPLGSPGFVAPEVVRNGPHTPAMDMFSLGVLLFVMLVGRKPFNIKESESLQYAFMQLQDAPGFRDPRWLDLSPDAKHLLMGLLTYDPSRRLTAQQVLSHEWVVSRGGRLPRPLGQDVVHGAATVATVRRLKNLCHGVAALSRATQVASAPGAKPRQSDSASSRDEYVRRLRSIQKDVSVRGTVQAGGSASGGRHSRPGAVQGLALNIASKSYSKIHDSGRSADPSRDPSRSRRPPPAPPATPANSCNSKMMEHSASRHSGRWWAGGGMTKSGTSVLLSEMDWREDASTRGATLRLDIHRAASLGRLAGPEGSAHSAGVADPGRKSLSRQGSLTSLHMLGASIKQYVDASLHGRRSVRGGTACRDDSRHSMGGSRHVRRVGDSATSRLPSLETPSPKSSDNSLKGGQHAQQEAPQRDGFCAQQQPPQQLAGPAGWQALGRGLSRKAQVEEGRCGDGALLHAPLQQSQVLRQQGAGAGEGLYVAGGSLAGGEASVGPATGAPWVAPSRPLAIPQPLVSGSPALSGRLSMEDLHSRHSMRSSGSDRAVRKVVLVRPLE